ncbi:MAG: FAD-binding oxidoreductase [Alphaproteobacteria bacterium]|nr:FAD-binding oxidoreductase [Alphaproteobacteria bacterium]
MTARPIRDPAPALIAGLKAIVGPNGWIADPADQERYLVDERRLFRGRTPLVVRPGTTDEVSRVVALCAAHDAAIVPQGGNTGLVGGGVPYESGDQIVLSLARMNRIRSVSALDYAMTVDAGCILVDIQEAARRVDRLFPLSLAAEGTCTIGGNLSTNAGGVNVLRYGSARDLVLGLEVVLADGRIWNGLRGLRKDNTGYDLKHVFMGAEGTLGIITGAVLKLFPLPRQVRTGFVGVPSVRAAVDLLSRLQGATGGRITAFEVLPRFGLDLVLTHIEGTKDPLPAAHPWYVLFDASSGDDGEALTTSLESALAAALDAGLVVDATLAVSEAQARALWRIRETLPEAQKPAGGSIKHDVSVPITRFAELIERAQAAVLATVPGVRPLPFGHLGDGNVHLNFSQPLGGDTAAFMAEWERVNHLVHDIVHELGGSISAEHGLGRLKREEIRRYKPPLELELMRTLKTALDPKGLLNPGKVL